ncbi:hypothetical protein Prum_052680 [Phytohabitans rumicis]|uniref:Uncharacterized protein n=1 Tax=Phytohabitans rumicis TaxID=1076125 RepID=A0A6V8LC29_9ACTN|nr:hypothetical protein Prum_052680 [Phytohabitans rumicis]
MSTPVADPTTPYDVAIVGGHLTPALLAAVLARQGVRVLLVDGPDRGTEPGGDSTVPYTTAVYQLLAERFDVPEIAAFAHFVDLPERVRRVSGIKKSLAFLHHTPGRRHDPAHTVQFHVPGSTASGIRTGRWSTTTPARLPRRTARTPCRTARRWSRSGRPVTGWPWPWRTAGSSPRGTRWTRAGSTPRCGPGWVRGAAGQRIRCSCAPACCRGSCAA